MMNLQIKIPDDATVLLWDWDKYHREYNACEPIPVECHLFLGKWKDFYPITIQFDEPIMVGMRIRYHSPENDEYKLPYQWMKLRLNPDGSFELMDDRACEGF